MYNIYIMTYIYLSQLFKGTPVYSPMSVTLVLVRMKETYLGKVVDADQHVRHDTGIEDGVQCAVPTARPQDGSQL